MNAESVDVVWLSKDNEFSLPVLAELSGLSEAELREPVDYGALEPINPDALQGGLAVGV